VDLGQLIETLAFAPGYIGILALDGTIEWMNRAGYGLDLSGVIGQPGDSFIAPEDRHIWHSAFSQARHLREVSDYEVRIQVPSPPGWARVWGRIGPVLANGEVRHLISMSHDITLSSSPSRANRFLLTDLGRRVVVYLREAGTAKGSAIGKQLGESSRAGQASSTLRMLLANLVEQGILQKGTNGYVLAPDFLPLAREI
jgi:hypothetical protein